jgi:hypothetical protein
MFDDKLKSRTEKVEHPPITTRAKNPAPEPAGLLRSMMMSQLASPGFDHSACPAGFTSRKPISDRFFKSMRHLPVVLQGGRFDLLDHVLTHEDQNLFFSFGALGYLLRASCWWRPRVPVLIREQTMAEGGQ